MKSLNYDNYDSKSNFKRLILPTKTLNSKKNLKLSDYTKSP